MQVLLLNVKCNAKSLRSISRSKFSSSGILCTPENPEYFLSMGLASLAQLVYAHFETKTCAVDFIDWLGKQRRLSPARSTAGG